MSSEEMNINGKDGVFIVGGWWVEFEHGEIEDVEIFLDRSDQIELNIDYQQDKLKVITQHPQYPNEYEIVQATDGKYYAVRYGTEEDFYSKEVLMNHNE